MDDKFVNQIQTNLNIVMEKVYLATGKRGRDAGSVRLIVVTKGQPLEIVKAAIQVGARILGENYAEEAVEKIYSLETKSEVEWHMIGHVQRRKTDLVARNFNMLHSLDSLKLAKKLDQSLSGSGSNMPVLFEFNVGGEMNKFGWQAHDPHNWDGFLKEIEQILELTNLTIKGLMTMPPYYDDPERSRYHFQMLVKLREFLLNQFRGVDLQELSMGTSSDYEVAVEEGATYIRIGQAILGKRPTQ